MTADELMRLIEAREEVPNELITYHEPLAFMPSVFGMITSDGAASYPAIGIVVNDEDEGPHVHAYVMPKENMTQLIALLLSFHANGYKLS